MNGPTLNTERPGVRCGMCGGRARVCGDPLYGRGARIIECASGYRGERCAWSSLNPARIDPSWYWRLRVWIGR